MKSSKCRPDPILRSTTPIIPLNDANGNITAYTELSGFVKAQFYYDAFGNVTERTDGYYQTPDDFNFRFSTKYQDFETDLNYYGLRYYKPFWGRWLNPDPIGERGGLNLYGFVGNNPVTRIDVLGLEDCWGGSYSSVELGNEGNFGTIGIGWSVSFSASFEAKKCTKCCGTDTINAGRTVTDDEIYISINGSATLSGSTGGGSIPKGGAFGLGSGSYWYGLKVAGGISGSASGSIVSDLCNNKERTGQVCFFGEGGLSLSGGGGVTAKAGWLKLNFGVDLTGTGKVTYKRCYVCSNGSCTWNKPQICLSGSLGLNAHGLLLGNSSWLIWQGNKCFDL